MFTGPVHINTWYNAMHPTNAGGTYTNPGST